MKLLYAEDERAMSEAVTDILTFHKYIVDAVERMPYADPAAYSEGRGRGSDSGIGSGSG